MDPIVLSPAMPITSLRHNLCCLLADDLTRQVAKIGSGIIPPPPSPAAEPGRYAVDRPVASPLDRAVLEDLSAQLTRHVVGSSIPSRIALTLQALLGHPAAAAAAAADLLQDAEALDGDILALMLMIARQWPEMEQPARSARTMAAPATRKAVLETLLRLGELEAAADLAIFAARSDPETRARAMHTLAWLNPPPMADLVGSEQDAVLLTTDPHSMRALMNVDLPVMDKIRLGYRWLCREPESVGAHIRLAGLLAGNSPEAAAYHQAEARRLSRAMLQEPDPALPLDIAPAVRDWRRRYVLRNPQALSWQAPGRPLINLRISACGSWSFSEMLKKLSPEDEDLDFGNHCDLYRRIPALDRSRLERSRIFQIHVPLALHRLLPGRPRYVTQIRNPISRILTLFYWHYNNRHEDWVPDYYRNGITLRQWLCDHYENDLCLWFLMVSHPIPRPFEYHALRHRLQGIPAEELAEMAVDAALKNFDFVGITELFSESMFIFGLEMNCDVLPLWKHLGSSGAPKPEDVHPDIVDMIKTRHAADILFYDTMRRKFENKYSEDIDFFRRHIGSLENKKARYLADTLVNAPSSTGF